MNGYSPRPRHFRVDTRPPGDPSLATRAWRPHRTFGGKRPAPRPRMYRDADVVQEMVRRGVYVHPWHNMFMCAAMTRDDIALALNAADDSFRALKAARKTLTPHPALSAMLESRR